MWTGELGARLSQEWMCRHRDRQRPRFNRRCAAWLGVDGARCYMAWILTMAILMQFSSLARSIHIHPLDESVKHAADSLVDGGRIIVEDFAYESADEKTLRWFASAIRFLEAASLLVEGV